MADNLEIFNAAVSLLVRAALLAARFIKGFDYLTLLCTEFESWYNTWRPHMTLRLIDPEQARHHPDRDARRDVRTAQG